MKLLLDTHIWLWGLLEPGRLSTKVASALGAPIRSAGCGLGACVTRSLLLIERKRLQVDRPAEAWVRDALERAPVLDAPVNRETQDGTSLEPRASIKDSA